MKRSDPMPSRFAELAAYNTAMHQQVLTPRPDLGDAVQIVFVEPDRPQFTEEHHARMAVLQAEFDVWSRQQFEAEGCTVIDMPDGGLLRVPW